MAGTARKVRLTGMPESDLKELVIQFNKLIDDYDAHTHTENAAAAYTQNATTSAPTTAATAAKVVDLAGNAPS